MHIPATNRGAKGGLNISVAATKLAAATGGAVTLAVLATLLMAARPAQAAAKETIIYSFNCPSDGCNSSGVVVDAEGNMYGTAAQGGANDSGTVFKITPSGTFSTLYNFCSESGCADGQDPYGGVILDSEGNLYGTTVYGGASADDGTVFKVTPSGKETVLHEFAGSDGAFAFGGLVFDSEGNLYGTTSEGGTNNGGTVFKITSSGTFSTLYNFCSETNCTDGEYPNSGLAVDSAGNVYGTTYNGGANTLGVVFKVSSSGKETVLHSFVANGEDGMYPEAGVVLNGTELHGTTSLGGKDGVGTVFAVTTSGTESILYSFAAGVHGVFPYAGLVLDKKGNLYGTTEYGGSSDEGMAFKVTPKGAETVLHSFAHNGTDGYFPSFSSLAINKSGDLYGTTSEGGDGTGCGLYGCGEVFRIVP